MRVSGSASFSFAGAAEDMKSHNWLALHRRMFAYLDVVRRVGIAICSQVTEVGTLSGLGVTELPQILPPDDTRPITLDYT